MADDLTKLRERLALAHKEVGEIAAQGARRRWRMSIPAQPDRDSDLLISRALGDAENLVVAIERVRAEHALLLTEIDHGSWCGTCHVAWPCPTIAAMPTDTTGETETPDA